MATTPNYGFIMPDPTDFVTNLPADFEIFGDEVDSRIKALNPETTAGDISYRGATADAKVRLGIGTAGQVLRVNSGATAPEWFTPAGSTKNYTLLNSGNTSVGTGTSFTVSGISAQDELLLMFDNISTNSASGSVLRVRFNGDTGSNYTFAGLTITGASTFAQSNFLAVSYQTQINITVTNMAFDAGSLMSGGFRLSGCNASGVKPFNAVASATANGSTWETLRVLQGFYAGTSTISSVTVLTNVGNFDGGNLFIYGAA